MISRRKRELYRPIDTSDLHTSASPLSPQRTKRRKTAVVLALHGLEVTLEGVQIHGCSCAFAGIKVPQTLPNGLRINGPLRAPYHVQRALEMFESQAVFFWKCWYCVFCKRSSARSQGEECESSEVDLTIHNLSFVQWERVGYLD
eukprot:3783488-Pleurochrysis_carterae.AAC.2